MQRRKNLNRHKEAERPNRLRVIMAHPLLVIGLGAAVVGGLLFRSGPKIPPLPSGPRTPTKTDPFPNGPPPPVPVPIPPPPPGGEPPAGVIDPTAKKTALYVDMSRLVPGQTGQTAKAVWEYTAGHPYAGDGGGFDDTPVVWVAPDKSRAAIMWVLHPAYGVEEFTPGKMYWATPLPRS